MRGIPGLEGSRRRAIRERGGGARRRRHGRWELGQGRGFPGGCAASSRRGGRAQSGRGHSGLPAADVPSRAAGRQSCLLQLLLLLACSPRGAKRLTRTRSASCPGWPSPSFRQYSGYLKSSGSKRLHYWSAALSPRTGLGGGTAMPTVGEMMVWGVVLKTLGIGLAWGSAG